MVTVMEATPRSDWHMTHLEPLHARARFTGAVETVLAWPNERLYKHQRVLSLREAS